MDSERGIQNWYLKWNGFSVNINLDISTHSAASSRHLTAFRQIRDLAVDFCNCRQVAGRDWMFGRKRPLWRDAN